jgi:formamidopyrimidine-DNA glycosylase
MPELPEVEVTVRAIDRLAKNQTIKDVWTDYGSLHHKGKENIKDGPFFEKFRKEILGRKILGASRRGKNVLIHLSGGITILAHMKMSGHFLYGTFKRSGAAWVPVAEIDSELRNPWNRFIHLVFILGNGKHLAFSDLRKFAKVTFFHDKDRASVADFKALGPEPLDPSFALENFKKRISGKRGGTIKQLLLDQSVIAGIGNIYSDEMLFEAAVHPLSTPSAIPTKELGAMYKAMKKILTLSISLGGDSASDFRTIDGAAGGFQKKHKAYHKTGSKCSKKGCKGTIVRLKIAGRSAHFCNTHQKRFS